MRAIQSVLLLSILMTSVVFAGGVTREVFKNTNNTNWLYLGNAPRFNDPTQIELHISKSGYAVRFDAIVSPEIVRGYARHIVERATQVKKQLGLKKYKVVETKKLQAYFDEIASRYQPVVDAESLPLETRPSEDELARMNRALFEENWGPYLFQRAGKEHLVVVYPITISKEGILSIPSAKRHYMHTVEERRSYYGGGGDVFGGFPAMWFSGGVGFHGPIRSTDDPLSNASFLTEENEANKLSRWQLVRKSDSHGCIRMEGEHVSELRHLLPKAHVLAKKVPINVYTYFDVFTPGDDTGEMVASVAYYWLDPSKPPVATEFYDYAYGRSNYSTSTDGTIVMGTVRVDVQGVDSTGRITFTPAKEPKHQVPVLELPNRRNAIVEVKLAPTVAYETIAAELN